MKKALLSLVILLCWYGKAQAAPPVVEAPIRDVGTPVTVAISSTTLTKVPTSQTSGRMGIFIDNPSTNTENIVGFLGDCSSTALASTIRPIELPPSVNTAYIPIREDICLWLLSLDTASATKNIHYQEIKQ